MKTTRTAYAAAALAALLTSGLGAAPTPQQGNPNDPWCQDGGRDISWGDQRENYCEVREFTVPASGATLTVNAEPNGGIAVEGGDRRDIVVRARINATARTMEEARAMASRIDVVATAERVEATGPQNLRDREGWSVSYRIAAPRATNLSLRSTNGGITINNVRSEMKLRTVNGGLSLTRAGGNIEGSTSNGGIKVTLDGSTWDGQGLDLTTSNGGVTVDIPASYSVRLDAGTTNGGLNVDLPNVTLDTRRGRTLVTDLGSGGPTLRIRTSNGGVHLRTK